MRLIENWTKVLKKAWSIRLIVLAGLLSQVEVLLPMFSDSMPRGLFAGVSLLVTVAAVVARVVAQPKMNAKNDA